MNPAKYAITYRQLTCVILLMLLAAGVFSFVTMPRQEDPDIHVALAQIVTIYPGANPLQVEQLVTTVIENELTGISGIERVVSESKKNYSSIFIELEDGTDIDKTWEQIREKLSRLGDKLPDEAGEPQFNTDLAKTVTALISVHGYDLRLLSQVAASLKTELLKLPAIATIETLGDLRQDIVITVDEQKLSRYQLPLARVIDSVKAHNINIPGSTLDIGSYQASLAATNQYQALSELMETVVAVSPQGWPLHLREVAVVELAPRDDQTHLRTDGQQAVLLEVTMKENENVIALGKAMNRVLEQEKAKAPQDVSIQLVADQPGDVANRLGTFSQTLLYGMMLVVLIVFLAMGWRNSLIVSLAIPLSVILAFAGMSLWQVSLHQISIAALIIALGILVDNAIVVNDNIYSHWLRGAPLLQACTDGVREVAIPVLTSTLTTISAFIPLIMMPGKVGQFIRAIPQVVSLTLLASLFIATTITPLVFYLVMRRHSSPSQAADSAGFSAMQKLTIIYQETLNKAMDRPRQTLAIALVFLLASSLLVSRLGIEFFPPSDKNLVIIQVETPAGTGLEKTDQVVREIEDFLQEQPLVRNFTSFVGRATPKFYYNLIPTTASANMSHIMVNLTTEKERPNRLSNRALATQWQNQLQNQLGLARVRIDLLEQGPPVGAPVAFRLLGPELDVLAELADEVLAMVREIPGTTAQTHSLSQQELLLDVIVSFDKAAMTGLTRLDVANTLRYYNEKQEISTIKSGTEEIPIHVLLTTPGGNSGHLDNLWIASPATGRNVPLGQAATLRPSWQWSTISHWKNQRVAFVHSYVESNHSANRIYSAALPQLASLELPPGYSLEIGGEIEDQSTSFMNLGQAAVIAVLLIYLILIFQFNSLTQPLLIVISIPLTVIGSVVGLFLLGYPIGFMALLGLVSLAGIVVNNAIILVDFINGRRREGLSIREAVATAGAQRLRPIILTTTTTIGGLMPLSLTGGRFWGPMGFAIIFGLLGSTLLTLIVVPVLYALVEKETADTARISTNLPQ